MKTKVDKKALRAADPSVRSRRDTRITLRLPREVREAIQNEANSRVWSMNTVIIHALVERYAGKEKP